MPKIWLRVEIPSRFFAPHRQFPSHDPDAVLSDHGWKWSFFCRILPTCRGRELVGFWLKSCAFCSKSLRSRLRAAMVFANLLSVGSAGGSVCVSNGVRQYRCGFFTEYAKPSHITDEAQKPGQHRHIGALKRRSLQESAYGRKSQSR